MPKKDQKLTKATLYNIWSSLLTNNNEQQNFWIRQASNMIPLDDTQLKLPPLNLRWYADETEQVSKVVHMDPGTLVVEPLESPRIQEIIGDYLLTESKYYLGFQLVPNEIDHVIRVVQADVRKMIDKKIPGPVRHTFLSQMVPCFFKADFDPKEGPCPVYMSYIQRMINWEGYEAFSGLVLTGDPNKRDQAHTMIGAGGSGKSTLAEGTVRPIFGSKNVIMLDEPTEDNKNVEADLVNHLYAAITEGGRENFHLTSKFKSLTGDGEKRVEKKFKNAWQSKPVVRIQIWRDNFPKLTREESVLRRMVPSLLKSRETSDYKAKHVILKALYEERAAIAYRWLEAAKKYVVDGEIRTPETRKLLEKILNGEYDNEDYLEHFRTCFVVSADHRVRASLVQDSLKNKSARFAEGFREFLRQLGVEQTRDRTNGDVSYYVGIDVQKNR